MIAQLSIEEYYRKKGFHFHTVYNRGPKFDKNLAKYLILQDLKPFVFQTIETKELSQQPSMTTLQTLERF